MENRVRTFEVRDLADDLMHKTRDFYLAGIGAFAQANEEGTKFFELLTEKGKEVVDYVQALQRRTFNLDEEARDLLKEGEALSEKLIEKGEKVEKEGLDAIRKWMDERQTEATNWQKDTVKTAWAAFEQWMKPVQNVALDTLENLGVPSSDDINTLTQKVEDLTAKVNELTALLAEQATKHPRKTTKATKEPEAQA